MPISTFYAKIDGEYWLACSISCKEKWFSLLTYMHKYAIHLETHMKLFHTRLYLSLMGSTLLKMSTLEESGSRKMSTLSTLQMRSVPQRWIPYWTKVCQAEYVRRAKFTLPSQQFVMFAIAWPLLFVWGLCMGVGFFAYQSGVAK